MNEKLKSIISFIAYYIFLISIVAFALCSCGSTRETRKIKRAEQKAEKYLMKSKMAALEGGITVKDTVQAIVTYFPKPSIIDTIFPITTDSIIIQNDDFIISYKRDTSGVQLSGQIKQTPKEFVADVVVDTQTKTIVKEKPLSWWQRRMIELGSGIVWILILLILLIAYLILRKFIKWLP